MLLLSGLDALRCEKLYLDLEKYRTTPLVAPLSYVIESWGPFGIS